MTLEHIIPQSNKDNYVGTIGNLLPLDGNLNNKIDRKPFANKLEMMRDSELYVVKDFISKYEVETDWNESNVNDRAASMVEIAYDQIWGF